MFVQVGGIKNKQLIYMQLLGLQLPPDGGGSEDRWSPDRGWAGGPRDGRLLHNYGGTFTKAVVRSWRNKWPIFEVNKKGKILEILALKEPLRGTHMCVQAAKKIVLKPRMVVLNFCKIYMQMSKFLQLLGSFNVLSPFPGLNGSPWLSCKSRLPFRIFRKQ